MRLHYAKGDFPIDGGCAAERWTLFKLGSLAFRLGNFQWRKRALPFHDLHHVLTNYPCTVTGEFQMAAWEFAAGRFPSTLSTLFCLPLIGAGAVATPTRSFAAFVRGRRSSTLYATPLTPDLLGSSVEELRRRLLPHKQPTATIGDLVGYFGLASLSLAFVAAPLLMLWILF